MTFSSFPPRSPYGLRARLTALSAAIAAFALFFSPSPAEDASDRPNILWIVVEDASPHIGCYGETAIDTPHLDRLADAGVRFTDAVVTSPVCSPSRSAMVTGMYQTTLGALHHRSQRKTGKGGGNEEYYDSFVLPVESVPELFREAGYHVTNSGRGGKEDYNFLKGGTFYHEGDWTDRADPDRPFFAQVQLAGGKARGAKVDDPVDPAEVELPPYYPDHPVIREDGARYLNSWMRVDREVGEIVHRLREKGELRDTVIFFWTDHGVSHLRGKQFLYEEGIHVPLIVRFGRGDHDHRAGMVRQDLVEHIDIAAASLGLAGIPIPDHVQGRDFFAADYEPRERVFSARDRCDETVETMRCVRTKRWKYIRNFLSFVPHAQPNQYKDGKAIVQTMRELHEKGELNELQSRPFAAPRPTEELYDLRADPHETVNLADDPEHAERLAARRQNLYDWMRRTGDPGLVPEPILEDLGREHGSKYAAMRTTENRELIPRLIALVEAGESGDRETLREALGATRPSLRYWACTWLGVLGDEASLGPIRERTGDDDPAVRVAAALALCRLGEPGTGAPILADHIDHPNLIVGMYAIRGLERIGPDARGLLPAIEAAKDSPYEFTRRYARRLARNLGDAGDG